jgi:acetyltransferase-like isoleucine patch superfamily enzyme
MASIIWKLKAWLALLGGALNSIPFRLFGADLAWSSMLGPGYSFFFCPLKGVRVEGDVRIGSHAWIQTVPNPWEPHPQILIRKGTHIGRNVVLSASKRIEIGEKCLLSYQVSILDHSHVFDDPHQSPVDLGITEGSSILIGDHCFIGAHSFIMPGVTLGRHCVVGANSVVTQSFPAFSVVIGSPARLVRSLPSS